nr:putative glucan 1,3-beta-glucosidase a [Quercus suber]
MLGVDDVIFATFVNIGQYIESAVFDMNNSKQLRLYLFLKLFCTLHLDLIFDLCDFELDGGEKSSPCLSFCINLFPGLATISGWANVCALGVAMNSCSVRHATTTIVTTLGASVVRPLLLCLLLLVACSKRVEGQIRGVNLGGWLVTEQWITPSLYSNAPDADDEWHLCQQLGRQTCQSTLDDHWNTFYNLDDFQAIRAAGLNTVRIPIGYWAVDLDDTVEPYVSGQFPYLIRAVHWATQSGLQVLIDLHGAPGSQNGQDNSGLIGPVLFPANSTNADRSLNVLRNLTEEFAQSDVYGDTVVGVELLNEPRLSDDGFPMSQLQDFYSDGANTVSAADAGMNVTIHGKSKIPFHKVVACNETARADRMPPPDAFWGPAYWANYNPYANSSGPANRLTLDTHQYYAFAPLNNLPHATILASVCNISQLLKQPRTQSGIPPTVVGEWSLETGSAPDSHNGRHGADDQARRTWFRLLFEAQHAAYSPSAPGQSSLGWIFWAWKTEYDIDTWSYRNGLAEGYIPGDVGNASQLAFPVLGNGCVDASFNYTAPLVPGMAAGSVRVDVWMLGAVVLGSTITMMIMSMDGWI